MTRILGLGCAAPTHRLTQPAAIEAARPCTQPPAELTGRFEKIYHRAGVDERGCVLIDPETTLDHYYPPAESPSTAERMARYEQAALPLATEAALAALESSGTDPEHITHLVTASCTGFRAPGVDVGLIETLGLSRGAQRTHLGFMGCHAALNALRVAVALGRADPSHVVLGVCVELCTLHFQYGWEPGQVVANALFGDGAGAFVATDRGSVPARRLSATASHVLPDTTEAMTWTIGDHGFRMTLGREVPGLIETHLPGFVDDFLAANGLSRGDVRHVAVHPGGPRILDAVEAALGLRPDDTAASRAVLREHGNMSSPTLLFILDRLVVGEPTLALAFGPGLTIEAALFDADPQAASRNGHALA